MKTVISSIAIAFAMYSKIPVPKTEWKAENMRYVMCFFPFVGGVIGGLVYFWMTIVESIPMSHTFFTVIIIMIPIVVTGGIHMDGLLDTTDALSSFESKQRKLEILKDPNTGAFGVITCVMYFFLTFAVWYDASLSHAPVLALGFILSRALSGLSIVSFPMAKSSGLAAMFCEESNRRLTRIIMILYIVATATGMILLNWKTGMLCLIGAFSIFVYYRIMSERQFGGITGDLAGYFLQICELGMAFIVVIGERMIRSGVVHF